MIINPLPDDKFQTLKLEEFADDNYKFDVNGRELSKRVENTVGNKEIASYEQFSFSHSVFNRLVSQGRQKVSLGVNGLTTQSPLLIILKGRLLNTLWKKKKMQGTSFSTMFSIWSWTEIIIWPTIILSKWSSGKFYPFGKKLTFYKAIQFSTCRPHTK